MEWYYDLYLGEKIAKKKNKLIYKINEGKLSPTTFVIVLPRNNRDILETFPFEVLKQKYYKRQDFFIVGLAKGREEANELMCRIIVDCFRQTDTVNVRDFILDREAKKDDIKIIKYR